MISKTVKSLIKSYKDVLDDVEGAMNAGMMGILVQTGKYRHLDENKLTNKPILVAENFSKAVDFILDSVKD